MKNSNLNNKNIKNNIIKNKPNTPEAFRQERLSRHLAFKRYMAESSDKPDTDDSVTDTGQPDEISLILDELKECVSKPPRAAKAFNHNENVIPLQLSDCLDEFISKLSPLDCGIFVKRYFYAEAVSTIAKLYKISRRKVGKVLKRCRQSLKTVLASKGYIFKSETLYMGFTDISDAILLNVSQPEIALKHKNMHQLLAAAGIVLCVGIGALITILSVGDLDEPAATIRYVDTAELLASATELEEYTAALQYTEQYKLIYTKLSYTGEKELSEYIGSKVELASTGLPASYNYEWYRLDGHNDMQYLIEKNKDNYYLYKFRYMSAGNSEAYPFSDTLSIVYDINGPEDIASLTITDSAVYTADGAEIDSPYTPNDISNTDTIAYLYYTLSSLTCYGPNKPDLIDTRVFSRSPVLYNLSITTAAGETINSLEYNNNNYCFYEKYNVAYSKLSLLTLDTLDKLLTQDTVSAAATDTWMLNAYATDVTTTGLTLHLTQYGGNLKNNLYLGENLTIAIRVGDSLATMISSDLEDMALIADTSYEIEPNSTSSYKINWENVDGTLPSGSLPSGSYKLWLDIIGPTGVSEDTYETRTIKAYFEIE